MKKILITGAGGMFAKDFIEISKWRFEIFAFKKEELDILDLEKIREKVKETKIDLILNLAAYTKVDEAEDFWLKLNYEVNTFWVFNLAKVAREEEVDFVTISTDYVFDGKKWNYKENEKENPLNHYWNAKFLWEKLAKTENSNSVAVRTSWLYGGGKGFKNFVNTMLKLWKEREELKVVNDQFWSPTNCKDLAKALCELIEKIENYKGETFHFSNETAWNWISWFDFAKEIFEQKKIQVKLLPCTSEEFKTKAKRPKFSKLENSSEIKLPNWRDGLKNYLKEN